MTFSIQPKNKHHLTLTHHQMRHSQSIYFKEDFKITILTIKNCNGCDLKIFVKPQLLIMILKKTVVLIMILWLL